MSFAEREKYVQGGSGQVFYLWQDDESGRWVLGQFTGGPSPVVAIGEFSTKAEAVEALTKMDCKVMT